MQAYAVKFRRCLSSPGKTARRLFWVFMLAAHTGAAFGLLTSLLRGGPEFDWGMGLGRAVLLIASTIFFVFKIWDVSWLRLRPGWRPFVASWVVIALLHVPVVQRAAGAESISHPAGAAAIVIAGTMFDVSRLRRLVRRLVLLIRAKVSHLAGLGNRAAGFRTLVSALAPPQVLFQGGLLCPRPPPGL